jgi:glycosyltransferase involved in cell wall biosynthesis
MHDVAMVINDLGNGGTQRVYSTIANEWAKNGRRVCIITRASPESDFHKIDSRVTRIVCQGIENSNSIPEAAWLNIKRIYSLRSAISEAAAPVTVAAIAPLAILSFLASIGLPTHLVLAERNDPSRQSFGRIWDFLRRIIYPRADLVTANSFGALKNLSKYVNSEKLEYLPNPVKIREVAASELDRQPVILNVGRMYKQKAQGTLLRAFAGLAPGMAEWRLAFAGTGPLRHELQALSEELGIADRVDWLGTVPDLSAHYANFSIFVLPSHHEGMPNALLEAMWSGMSCVISDASPGPLEVIEDKINGLVFPVDDVSALTGALSALMQDRDYREKLGSAAREKSQEFEITNVLKIWDRVLRLPATGTDL